MIAVVFPGQGSEHPGMGAGLFDQVPEFTEIEAEADDLLGYSVRHLCLEGPVHRLKQTQYTQPAIFVVNALYYFKARAEGVEPACIAGHSLGEYNALLAAGAFDLLTGLRLVHKRGELMSAATGGGMAAVIGLPAPMVQAVCNEHGMSDVDIASFNAPLQTVISGPLIHIRRAGGLFESAGASLYGLLDVGAAFHSRYMKEAAAAFGDFLTTFSFRAPRVPVIANVTGQPYPMEDGASAVPSLLVRQITEPVQWVATIRYMINNGLTEFRELAAGNVLTRLIQQIERESRP